jgi:hypothetical protein
MHSDFGLAKYQRSFYEHREIIQYAMDQLPQKGKQEPIGITYFFAYYLNCLLCFNSRPFMKTFF